MKRPHFAVFLSVVALGYSLLARSQENPQLANTTPTSAAPAEFQRDDRLLVSGDVDSLSGNKGGGGGSVGFLHQANAHWLLGAAGEYQSLAHSHWEFGSLNAAFTHSLTPNSLWSVRAEGHDGVGQSAGHRFDYSIVAAGLGLSVPGGVGFDLEERQIDVDTSHGSLPKIALSKTWGSHWSAAAGYAHSYGGNLNTEYGLLRVDFYTSRANLLGGASIGRVSPAVLNVDGVLQSEARHLKEGFFGITAPLHSIDLTLLGDEIDLAGIKRFTVTFSMIVHLR